MKKNQLISVLLMTLIFACENQEETPEIDFHQLSGEFNTMFSGSLDVSKKVPIASIVERTEESVLVRLEVENMSLATGKYLARNHFERYELPDGAIMYPLIISSRLNPNARVEDHVGSIIDQISIFSEEQKTHMSTLTNEIMELSEYSDGYEIVNDFKASTINSMEFTNEEKIMLLEFASGTEELLRFMENGGTEQIQASLNEAIGDLGGNERIMDCSVDWRGVWGGAVVGFAGGAVYGGIVGATAGTFSVPILGTAAGGIGGAVFGGAWGFASGAVSGVAVSSLTTCGRSTTFQLISPVSCDQAWEAYLNNEITEIPSRCFTVPISL